MHERAETGIWNLPNGLSFSRLFLGALACGLIGAGAYVWALAVLIVASVTDWLDGFAARRMGLTSSFGRQLDPLVDKVLVCACLAYLLPLPASQTGLAPWMVAAILARELIVQALRSAVEGSGIAFGARWAGKWKATLQFVSILAILAGLGLELPAAWSWPAVCRILLWITVGLTVYSGLLYVLAAWRLLATARPALATSPNPVNHELDRDDRPEHPPGPDGVSAGL
jgi:CDP-diacylglycerol--glycerol-3-phosphate 3-phosphatidyltransferase